MRTTVIALARRLALAGSALFLAGCAATQLDATVHTTGNWPVGRAPGSFAYERLPSQMAQPEEQDRLEAEALPALAKAGFTPVASGETPDVRVQVAARTIQGQVVYAGPYYGGPWGPWGGWGSKRTEAWNRVAAQGAKVMARGHWVIMFPEGTRIARGKAGTYKSGGTRLAVATGRPVVPIAVNSARCWPRKSFLLTPGVVDVSIGRPIASVGREADELMREVETWIEAEMRRIDPEAYAAA